MILKAILTHSQAKKKILYVIYSIYNWKFFFCKIHIHIIFSASKLQKKKKNYPLTIRPNFFHLCKFVKMFHVSHTQKKTRKGNDWLTQRSVCQSSQRNINDHIRMHTMANLNFFMQNNHNMLVIVILQYNVARFSLVFSS